MLIIEGGGSQQNEQNIITSSIGVVVVFALSVYGCAMSAYNKAINFEEQDTR